MDQREGSDLRADQQIELARRIAAAWMSVKLGIDTETAYREHCLEVSPGEAWLNLARLTELVGRKVEQDASAKPQASQH